MLMWLYTEAIVEGCGASYVLNHVRGFTATDDCDNATSTATQTITVVDTTAPEFLLSQLITQQSVQMITRWMPLLQQTTVREKSP